MANKHAGNTRSATSPGANTRSLILDTSAELFSLQGYTSTGVRQIADRVGLRTASVYYHFASKECIVEEVMKIGLAHTFNSTRDAVNVLPENASDKDKIEAAIKGHLQGIHSNPDYTSVNIKFHGQLPQVVAEEIDPLRDEYIAYWRTLIEDAKANGWIKPDINISILRPLIMGTLNRTLTWFDPELGPIDEVVKTVIEVYTGIWASAKK